MTPLALGVPLTVVTVLGLLLNGYILLVVLLTKQAQTANSLLLLHLAAVDALLCALFLLFPAPGLLLLRGGGSWLGDGEGAACALHGFLLTLLHPVALWTVCGLHCDRYCAIAAPLHYGALVSVRRVALGLAGAWLLALALSLPPLFLAAPTYRYSAAQAGCAPDASGALWFSAAYTALALLLPAALILACNIKVLMIARYHRHRIASAIFEVALSAQVTIMHQRNPLLGSAAAPAAVAARSLYRGRNAVPTVLQLVAACVVLYAPWHGALMWEAAAGSRRPTRTPPPPTPLLALASALLACAPPVNGLLYGVRSKLLRKTFQNYWRKQMSKSEMNQEIQARTPSACGSRRPSLTPLGLLTRPCASQLQRRLSEALLDPHRGGGSPQTRGNIGGGGSGDRPRIQRIASELDWRPAGLEAALSRSSFRPHAVSCNTLRVPESDDPPPSSTVTAIPRVAVVAASCNKQQTLSSANLFLQRVFGAAVEKETPAVAAIQTVLTTPRRSPRILITRAYSEESDHSPPPAQRKHSTSTTSLLDRRWRQYPPEPAAATATTTTTNDGATAQVANQRDDDSSSSNSDDDDDSDASSGGLYLSLDGPSRASTVPLDHESQKGSVLSWPASKRYSASNTMVHLARSLTDVSTSPEFVL